MADDKTNDVLMQFCITAGDGGIPAECQTQIDWRNELVPDFWDGQYFEIQDFGFGMNLDDGEGGDKAKDAPLKSVTGMAFSGAQAGKAGGFHITSPAAHSGRTGLAMAAAAMRGGASAAGGAAGSGSKFQRWKSLLPGQVLDPPYRLKLDEFNFTRQLDKASPVLFTYCCNSLSFDSVALVKRKVTGDSSLQAFLRMDFDHVLVTKLDWDDGPEIIEKCSFVFRGFKLRYLRQNADGSLGSAGMVEWQYSLDLIDPSTQ